MKIIYRTWFLVTNVDGCIFGHKWLLLEVVTNIVKPSSMPTAANCITYSCHHVLLPHSTPNNLCLAHMNFVAFKSFARLFTDFCFFFFFSWILKIKIKNKKYNNKFLMGELKRWLNFLTSLKYLTQKKYAKKKLLTNVLFNWGCSFANKLQN